jgi:hypothetical protein
LANPDPEVDPFAASTHAAIVATGRSDYPNQINNVLVPAVGGHYPLRVLWAATGHLVYSTDFDVVDLSPGRLARARDLLIAGLTGYCTAHSHEDYAVRLRRAPHHRQLLEHAIGILIARLGISEDLG